MLGRELISVLRLKMALLTVVSASHLHAQGGSFSYFDLGPKLVEEFQGSSEFKYKRLEFARGGNGDYIVRSSGDQSTIEEKLVKKGGEINWILNRSEERWLVFRDR